MHIHTSFFCTCLVLYFHQLFYQLFVVCFLASEATPLGGAGGTKGIFGFCWTRVGCGPASGPTLKKALCCICPVVGQRINKGSLFLFGSHINKS